MLRGVTGREGGGRDRQIWIGMITIHTVETRLQIQYIVFITIVEDTMGRRRVLRPFALSVVSTEEGGPGELYSSSAPTIDSLDIILSLFGDTIGDKAREVHRDESSSDHHQMRDDERVRVSVSMFP
jgi:hypothetical protein